MAFTGTPVIQQISDKKVRVTGVSLASAAVGTIGTVGSGAQVILPAAFMPEPTTYDGVDVTPAEAVTVTTNLTSSVATAIPLEITKAGSTEKTFVATFTNTHGSLATPTLEITLTYL